MFNMVSTTLARFERCISGMVAWGKASNSYANRKEHMCVTLFRILGQVNDLDDCRFQMKVCDIEGKMFLQEIQ
jgi:hypothetical protein